MAKYYTVVSGNDKMSAIKVAEEISREMFDISRPKGYKNSEDVTVFLFGIIENKDGSLAAIEVDDSEFLPVHLHATIDTLLTHFDKVATKEEMDALSTVVEQRKESSKSIAELLPENMPKFGKKELVTMGFIFGEINRK